MAVSDPHTQNGFLNVTSSLTGRRWVGPGVESDRKTEKLAQETGLPLPVCKILSDRDVEADEVNSYLAPTLKEQLPDPRSLKDMERAAERVNTAVTARQRIAIFADYDVDGGSSAALLIEWLRDLGQDATLYVPDRIDEGYGPNDAAMAMLAQNHELIICVDCGTLSHGPIEAAQGADVVVLDHHLGGEILPPALAVVNPNRQDETGALGHLCAAGVVFLMLVEANRQRRIAGQTTPDLIPLLDLVALATVADVAPLIGVNRAFVRQGLAVMARRGRPGIVALGDVARLDMAPTPYHLGYVFGPRVNAGGRIGKADLGARLLSTQDRHTAAALAEKLDALNHERRAIESAVTETALEQAEERGLDAPLVWAAGEGWHPGVVGIVASRLKEKCNRPAIVIGLDGAEGKGSGRSVSGIDLGATIHRVADEGLLLKGGGHKMAAGLSVDRKKLDQAMSRISELLEKQGAGAMGAADLRLDSLLFPGAATLELIEILEQAGPYGAGSPAPRFVFPDLSVRFAKQVGEGHLKLTLADSGGQRIEAIAFGAMQSDLGPAMLHHCGQKFHVAGRLEVNVWRGKHTVQLRVEDAAKTD